MSQQIINIGAAPNDGTGDTLRAGGAKINDNFTELYRGVFSVLTYGAVGDGTTDDTVAFQNALNAAGVGGYVLAPAGYTYLLNGVTLNKTQQKLEIFGDVVVPPGATRWANNGIMLDTLVGAVEASQGQELTIHGRIYGQEQIAMPNSAGHYCNGVVIAAAGAATVTISRAAFLTDAVALYPGLSPTVTFAAGDNYIWTNQIERCYICIHGVGGPHANNHTQGTYVKGVFWPVFAYAIKKDVSPGDQGLWNVDTCTDSGLNPSFVATVDDPFGFSYYNFLFCDGAVSGGFIGAGFNPSENSRLFLYDVVNGIEYHYNTSILAHARALNNAPYWARNFADTQDYPLIMLATDDNIYINPTNQASSVVIGGTTSTNNLIANGTFSANGNSTIIGGSFRLDNVQSYQALDFAGTTAFSLMLLGADDNIYINATNQAANVVIGGATATNDCNVRGNLTVSTNVTYSGGLVDAVNDAAAAALGVAVNQLYRNGSVVMIRVV